MEVVGDALTDALRKRGRVTVMLAGRSGVGKSTLLNAVFGRNVAETGVGRPVTQETKEYRTDDDPLAIVDTRGLEMADYKPTLSAIKDFVITRRNSGDANEHVHIAWVCLLEDSARVEQAEIDLVKTLSDLGVSVVAVITKTRGNVAYRREVERLLPEAVGVVQVRAMAEEFMNGNEVVVLSPFGLDRLVEVSSNSVPEAQRRAFGAAQKISVEQKVLNARKVVYTSATTAATTAAIPFPFADAALLAPIQIAMIAGVTSCFGMKLDKAKMLTLSAAVVGASGATITGRMLVGSIIKMIPGLGSIAGATINGAAAMAITSALGEAYIVFLTKIYSASPSHDPSFDEVIAGIKGGLTSAKPATGVA